MIPVLCEFEDGLPVVRIIVDQSKASSRCSRSHIRRVYELLRNISSPDPLEEEIRYRFSPQFAEISLGRLLEQLYRSRLLAMSDLFRMGEHLENHRDCLFVSQEGKTEEFPFHTCMDERGELQIVNNLRAIFVVSPKSSEVRPHIPESVSRLFLGQNNQGSGVLDTDNGDVKESVVESVESHPPKSRKKRTPSNFQQYKQQVRAALRRRK